MPRQFLNQLGDGDSVDEVYLLADKQLRANRIAFRTRTAPGGQAAFLSDPCALPVHTGVVDLVVLPHVLEFSSNPHQVLREVSRILMPEGTEGHPLRKDYPLGYEEPQFTFNFEEIDVRKPRPKE